MSFSRYTRGLIEQIWYMIVCLFIYFLLVGLHVKPFYPQIHFGFWTTFITWGVTFFGGDYLIGYFESFLLKKRIRKLAKELALLQGIDPDTLDYDNVTVEYDEETGIMDVIIEEKKEGDK